jgi:hypothetical protein
VDGRFRSDTIPPVGPFNVVVDVVDEKPSWPKALAPIRRQSKLRKWGGGSGRWLLRTHVPYRGSPWAPHAYPNPTCGTFPPTHSLGHLTPDEYAEQRQNRTVENVAFSSSELSR